jgi:hypothetical protein
VELCKGNVSIKIKEWASSCVGLDIKEIIPIGILMNMETHLNIGTT